MATASSGAAQGLHKHQRLQWDVTCDQVCLNMSCAACAEAEVYATKMQVCGTLKSSPLPPTMTQTKAAGPQYSSASSSTMGAQRSSASPAPQDQQSNCASGGVLPPQQSRCHDHRTFLCLLQMMDVHGVMTCLLQRD